MSDPHTEPTQPETLVSETDASAPPLLRVALVGAGSMGGAILAGLRAPGGPAAAPISVSVRSAERAADIAIEGEVLAYATEGDADANRRAVRGAGVVVLAVKPHLVPEVLAEIASELVPGVIVASVAAGVTTARMEALVPPGVAVVRAMPNTPSLIGRGVTGIAAGASATAEQVALVHRVFRAVGEVLVVDESRIDALTAVSGSGPAYLFLFAEALTGAAERLGFSAAEARLLVEGTMAGAAELLARSDDDPETLRRRVTSPGGTTERAIEVLQQGAWPELFDRALAAARDRAIDLSR